MWNMTETERRHDEALTHIQTAIANEFCEIINRTGLPPMVVMRLAAQAIGTIYREAARAHSGVTPCPCGWQPHPQVDIEVLSTALQTAGRPSMADDLASLRPVGNA